MDRMNWAPTVSFGLSADEQLAEELEDDGLGSGDRRSSMVSKMLFLFTITAVILETENTHCQGDKHWKLTSNQGESCRPNVISDGSQLIAGPTTDSSSRFVSSRQQNFSEDWLAGLGLGRDTRKSFFISSLLRLLPSRRRALSHLLVWFRPTGARPLGVDMRCCTGGRGGHEMKFEASGGGILIIRQQVWNTD